MTDDERQAKIDYLHDLIVRLGEDAAAEEVRDAKLYPERTLAKVLEFKPRSA